VRGFDEERVLWVDALCINQEDEAEKSSQVRLMTEIYKYSWLCLAWLGEFEEDVVLRQNMSLDAYRALGVTMDKADAQRALNFVEKLSKLSTDGHFTADENRVPAGWASVTQPEVTAVNKLMNLNWWHRTWTVQEFIVPARVALVLGTIRCQRALEVLAFKPQEDMGKHDRSYGAKLPDFPAAMIHFDDSLL
jgi:hypothetical protein